MKIAYSDAKRYAKEEKKKYEQYRASELSCLSESDQIKVVEYIKKRETQIINQTNLKYKQKFNHLVSKHGETHEECPSEVPGMKGSKQKQNNRRFIKRSKYKRRKRAEARKQVNLVHNLCNFQLTDPMTQILNKGLSFVVTPKNVNCTLIRSDLAAWKRTMLWKEFHSGKEESDSTPDSDSGPPDVFKTKKSNLPQGTPPQSLQNFLSAVESETLGTIRKDTRMNVTSEEFKAIQELKQKQDQGIIRLSPVDKGGGIAILDTQDYIKEMYDQHLQSVHKDEVGVEHKFYEPATASDVARHCGEIRRVLDEGVQLEYISKNDRKVMEPPEKPGRLYGMPKLHKEIKEGHSLPPLRPIVSGSGSSTEKISEFVDQCVKEQVREIESFIEDTPDFLRTLQEENSKGPQPKQAFPVTFDICGLYNNINARGEDGGLQAFARALERRQDKRIPTYYIMMLLSLVLDGNFFEFCDRIFKQLIGTAMGTRAACSYACIFVAWLETTKLLGQWQGNQPHLWRRFIDDIFCIWRHGEEELQRFIDHLNSCHPLIKFTAQYDTKTKSVPFLDTVVSINDEGYLETDLFKKSCSRIQYLLPSSCHPQHISANIPFSLGYRLLRICSMPRMFELRLEELRQDLFQRGYPAKVVNDAFARVRTIPREEALKKVEKKTNTREVLATSFHPGLPPLAKVLKRHHQVMLEEDATMKKVFPTPSLVCYRRHRNLRDMLIRAKVSGKRQPRKKPVGFKKCHNSGGACIMCVHCKDSKTHKCHRTGKSWDIKSPLDCRTKNVVYKLLCKRCPSFLYIGETSRRAIDRYYQHRSYISNKNMETPAGSHFNSRGHSIGDLEMLPIEKVRPANNPHVRKCREKMWINLYQAVQHGENRQKSS